MKRFAIGVLVAAAVLLMLYPFWGLLHPESYAPLLAAEFGLEGDPAPHLVERSAAMNWASNGILASSFVCLAGFVANPARTVHARWAAGCLIAYPFVRAAVLAWSGFSLTSNTDEPEFVLFFGGEDTVYLVFGIALLGIAASLRGSPDQSETTNEKDLLKNMTPLAAHADEKVQLMPQEWDQD